MAIRVCRTQSMEKVSRPILPSICPDQPNSGYLSHTGRSMAVPPLPGAEFARAGYVPNRAKMGDLGGPFRGKIAVVRNRVDLGDMFGQRNF